MSSERLRLLALRLRGEIGGAYDGETVRVLFAALIVLGPFVGWLALGGSCEAGTRAAGECALITQFAADNGWFAFVVAGVSAAAFWLFGDVVERRHTRPCPRCGHRVPVGELDCASCEFDFRSV